ncbi:MAG: amino acid ABC transporter substrate-binding protein [Campylobacteraceae bacterium]|nr:amino acid ABC transporter substrate-binding protein [Campylobacteraceae bacterium]
MRLFITLFFIVIGINTMAYADVLSSIEASKKMRVCIWPEYYGISYVDPRTQKLIGIDVDLAYQLGRDLGVSVDFVESSFATLIEDIQTKKCDIAMFAIGRTPQRLEHLALTTPHLASDIYAIATKSSKRIQQWDDIDKEGVIVAVSKGTYHVEIMQKRLLKAKLLIVDSLHTREQEVESGRADVFMTDFPFGMRMVEQRDWAKLIRPTKPFHITPYGWAMAQGEERFLERVESFIKTIKKDGRLWKAARTHHLEPIVLIE